MREREFSFFCFSFRIVFLCMRTVRPRGAQNCLDASKKFTQFNSILSSIFTKFTHQSRYFCYFSVKAKSEYAHHQTKSTQRDRKKRNLFKHRREHMAAEAAKNTKKEEEKKKKKKNKERGGGCFGGGKKKNGGQQQGQPQAKETTAEKKKNATQQQQQETRHNT